jgi:hypothetical protein
LNFRAFLGVFRFAKMPGAPKARHFAQGRGGPALDAQRQSRIASQQCKKLCLAKHGRYPNILIYLL